MNALLRLLLLGLLLLATRSALLSSDPTTPRTGGLVVSVPTSELSTGAFRIALSEDPPRFSIHHPAVEAPIAASAKGSAFLSGATGTTSFREVHGMFTVESTVDTTCTTQSIDSFFATGATVTLRGRLECAEGPVGWEATFTAATDARLDFELHHDGPLDRVWLSLRSPLDEGFFGFGEQFNQMDHKGLRVPILVSEQGIGRGLQPLTFLADLLADAGGSASTTYAPVPHFISTEGRGMALRTHAYAVFDLRDRTRLVVENHGDRMAGSFYAAEEPLALVEAHSAAVGRMRPLPDWAMSGAILGIQGGTDVVREKVARAKRAGVPIAGVWMQDWSGQRMENEAKRLWWNWVLDDQRYPGWDEMVRDLEAEGIRTTIYANPYMSDVSEVFPGRRNLLEEARTQGYLVTHEDGSPYFIESGSIEAAPIDVTNPDAVTWFKQVIRDEMLDRGARGWMADFGEAMPVDGVVHGGEGGVDLHNAYPELWAKLNREAIDEAGLGDEVLFWTRSGYTGSPAHTTLMWLGDQMVTWDRFDGFKTVTAGLMSSGISGFQYNHADVGGYTTIPNPIGADYFRSKELFQRWTELSAFTPIFRTHEGNIPEANHQFDSDEDTLAHFARMVRLYVCLKPYRHRLIEEASTRGWPMIRHPWLHAPRNPRARDIVFEQFMLGADVMVVPVLDPATTEVEAWLPEGEWTHLWTGARYGRGDHRVDAPLGRPTAFLRAGSSVETEARACAAQLDAG